MVPAHEGFRISIPTSQSRTGTEMHGDAHCDMTTTRIFVIVSLSCVIFSVATTLGTGGA